MSPTREVLDEYGRICRNGCTTPMVEMNRDTYEDPGHDGATYIATLVCPTCQLHKLDIEGSDEFVERATDIALEVLDGNPQVRHLETEAFDIDEGQPT